MKPQNTWIRTMAALLIALASSVAALWLNASASAQGSQVQVTAADPPSAAQGTINLNVKVTGRGFKKGAASQFFVSGSYDPGGVTVNSTTFVNSTEVTANITISETATIATFDIAVMNPDGRGGKGTELFAVTSNANASRNACTVQPLPAGITLLGSLNYVTSSDVSAYQNLGISIGARQMTLNGAQVVVVGVGAPPSIGKLEIFFIDPTTGQVLDETIIGSGTSAQPHVSVNYVGGARSLAVGDVNGDGIPDFVAGSSNTNSAHAFVGSLNNGIVDYQTYLLPMPPSATSGGFNVGWDVAVGDLNGNGHDVIAVGALGGGARGNSSAVPGQVSLFSFNGSEFTNTQNILSPLPNPKKDEDFGKGLAIADVTGTGAKDLIVGAPRSIVNGVTEAGRVFVFPGPVSSTNYLTFSGGLKGERFGIKVASGDVNGDLIADALGAADGTDVRAQLYNGLVVQGQSPNFVLRPISGLSTGWSTTEPNLSDINGDGLDDVLIGAPNAVSGSVCGGVAYLYLSGGLASPLSTRIMLGTPVLDPGTSNFQVFGWAAAFAPGTRLFFVTDHGADLGATSSAGQVYVYKLK